MDVLIVIWDLNSLQMLEWGWLEDLQTVDSQRMWLSLASFDIKDLIMSALSCCDILQLYLILKDKTYQCVIDFLVCFDVATIGLANKIRAIFALKLDSLSYWITIQLLV